MSSAVQRSSQPESRARVAVVVLGDVGRSPRMQYHALALAEDGAEVDVVGQAGSPLPAALSEHPHVDLHLMPLPQARRRQRWPRPVFLGYAALKVLWQGVRLGWQLRFGIPAPDVVLVQNPPAIPTLLVALVIARRRGAKLVIDWHNLGYSMLTLTVGNHHPAVRLSRWYERVVGRSADGHLCVSRAMRAKLAQDFGIAEATVLYDRPAPSFAPTPLHLRHDLFRRLGDLLPRFSSAIPPGDPPQGNDGDLVEKTAVTCLRIPAASRAREIARDRAGGGEAQPCPPEALEPFVRLRADRPAVIVSATSWSADEDFSVLLDAAARCDEMIRAHEARSENKFPALLILLSGRGPLRALYEERIRRLALGKVHLRTLWLSPEDYPLLIGSADLGVCMHRSSSAVDLPMKIADMFGAGVPVCALDYGPCLAEVVEHERNGLLFSSAGQLAEQWFDLFSGFPGDTARLDRLRRGTEATSGERWPDVWNKRARPLFRALLSQM